ncbi:hypothetical protein CANARDRAFT_26009 [[Candida] arabinofermentans NRRL YB-2248]|uniref:Protein SYS1 n=1 Tax=[Candida] arabinofermentans NRRL YB-2248 TaxID=983967 RepID=A0A1E4T7S0_9ASCO|nr:hypothetical protein CANARDRAFT_26009 [[Candida] arabinofermentans NRRL YB-2248]
MFESFKSKYHSLPNLSKIGHSLDSLNSTLSPARLFFQIVVLQVFYYLAAIVLFYFTAQLSGQTFSLNWCFSWELVSWENTLGLTLSALWLFDSLISVAFITLIIGRSKLAWDFAITVHLINLGLVWLNSGFPKRIYWWLLQGCSCCIMIGLGTWTTRWKELRETFFDGIADAELGQAHHSSPFNAGDITGSTTTTSATTPDPPNIENIPLKDLS